MGWPAVLRTSLRRAYSTRVAARHAYAAWRAAGCAESSSRIGGSSMVAGARQWLDGGCCEARTQGEFVAEPKS